MLKARSDLTASQRDVAYAVFTLFASMGKLNLDLLQMELTPFDPEALGPVLAPVDKINDNHVLKQNPLGQLWSNLTGALN